MNNLTFLYGYITLLALILATLPSCNETAKASLATAVTEETVSKECQYPKKGDKCWDGHDMTSYLCRDLEHKTYTKRDGSIGRKCLKMSVGGKYPNSYYVKYLKSKK